MILTVTVPNERVFEAYDYGYGTVLRSDLVTLANGDIWVRYTVSFESRYHAECQRDRFQSGLYGASLLDTV